ncbi:MAG: hydrogenase accessory protein or high-affinity nickel-transport protein-like protein rane protein [Myxococcaceae bacterium]|nr:hydrogenase accessory protein or high-affinity nickel-transport protein-like protein rane protein [Myxococcaceae bacterium]
MLVFLSGLFAGSLHVVSGPDHVAAIAPLAMREPTTGGSLGAVWGVGHGGGVALWLVLAACFRSGWGYELPPQLLEALVGASLIALGGVSYLRVPHSHEREPEPRHPTRARTTALAMGALHGSAGATHLLSLLPTLGLPTEGLVSYAAGYLVAGVLAMATVTGLIGRLSVELPDLARLRRGCALLVLSLGLIWLGTSLADLT